MALVEGREHVVLSNIEHLFAEKNKEIADLKDRIADLQLTNQKEINDLKLVHEKEIKDLKLVFEKEINDLKLVHQTTFDKYQTETKEAMDKVQADNNKIFADLQEKIKILQGNYGVNLYSFVKDNFYECGWKLAPIVFIAPMILYSYSAHK
jgi:hypothetical protein